MRSGEQDRAVRRHYFAPLAAGRPGTAAQKVPLVMWQDAFGIGREGTEANVALQHEDFCSLYIVRRGRGTHVIDGVEYGIARGDVYVMGPGMKHYFVRCDQLITDTLHFSTRVFDAAAREALAHTPGVHPALLAEESDIASSPRTPRCRWVHLTPGAYERVSASVEELYSEWACGTPAGTLLTRPLFLRLLVQLARHCVEGGGASTQVRAAVREPVPRSDVHEATIAAAVRYMDEHFTEPLRIEQVAAQVYLSPDRFTRVFTEKMGRTPRDYLRHLRVERARLLLTTTDTPLSEVARASGLGDAAYLTRVLRASCGATPRDVRRSAAPARRLLGDAPAKQRTEP